MTYEAQERIIKKEDLKLKRKNIFTAIKGVLILTNTRLYFIKRGKNENDGKLFEASLDSVVNVRAYKAYWHGVDYLEIRNSNKTDEQDKKTIFMRHSIMQELSSVNSIRKGGGGSMGRLEANSLNNWETEIMQARANLDSPVANQNNSSSNDITGEISKLAELHKQGVLNDQEFTDAKAKLINK